MTREPTVVEIQGVLYAHRPVMVTYDGRCSCGRDFRIPGFDVQYAQALHLWHTAHRIAELYGDDEEVPT